eukprot:5972747-Pyramimonas_sp.AAC.1
MERRARLAARGLEFPGQLVRAPNHQGPTYPGPELPWIILASRTPHHQGQLGSGAANSGSVFGNPNPERRAGGGGGGGGGGRGGGGGGRRREARGEEGDKKEE